MIISKIKNFLVNYNLVKVFQLEDKMIYDLDSSCKKQDVFMLCIFFSLTAGEENLDQTRFLENSLLNW